jgi:hypothetical protein
MCLCKLVHARATTICIPYFYYVKVGSVPLESSVNIKQSSSMRLVFRPHNYITVKSIVILIILYRIILFLISRLPACKTTFVKNTKSCVFVFA